MFFNFRPTSLWILNPGLLLRTQPKFDDLAKGSETDSLAAAADNKSYGTIEGECVFQHSFNNDLLCVGNKKVIESAPDCWICLQGGDVNDLFRPCRCSAVHKSCLYTWLTEVSARSLQAQEC